ncbi:MAG: ABC transporter ATP-binding protein [Anaerolineae bacterium]|nr:ABC transporter ATP-binding protein [Anaerolineae bacterium]
MDDYVIEAKDLTKRYGDFVAVNSLNLQVKRGEVYGILGPNGSGKTTTILMLLGLTEPTSGWVRVLGFDPARQPLSLKAHVGYLPDEVGFYGNMTATENLAYIARLNGLRRAEADQRIARVLERMGLQDVADHKVKTFSRGMRQRLGVAELLLKQPEIIIMDEPTLGLDPEAAHQFLGTIRDLANDGITILLSSHLLHQVQETCDRVGLFYQGQIVLEGSVPQLARQVLGGAYRVNIQVEQPTEAVTAALQALAGVTRVHHDGSLYVLEASEDVRADAAAAVVHKGGRLQRMDIVSANLDEIYEQYFKGVSHGTAA